MSSPAGSSGNIDTVQDAAVQPLTIGGVDHGLDHLFAGASALLAELDYLVRRLMADGRKTLTDSAAGLLGAPDADAIDVAAVVPLTNAVVTPTTLSLRIAPFVTRIGPVVWQARKRVKHSNDVRVQMECRGC
jgi:hypothetical protein